ncbi:MAG: hypothetical protein EOO89_31250 [Pedobacter sp.]|nr:MAG: hypothetical protein EOO89_31250 [Pedobacter sp.]
MKTLKRINLAILAIVLGFGLVITQSAFKAPKTDVTIYQYDGDSNDMEDFQQGNWVEVNGGTDPCGTPGDVVCRIEFDGDLIDLQTFLDNTTDPDDVIVKQIASKE